MIPYDDVIMRSPGGPEVGGTGERGCKIVNDDEYFENIFDRVQSVATGTRTIKPLVLP